MHITPRLRPRVEIEVATPPAEVAERVNRMLKARPSRCRGFANEHQIELHVSSEEKRFWSPQLLLHMTMRDGVNHLSGHYGPNGEVWTMFMACYGSVVLSALVGVMLGVSQSLANEPAWGLWAAPLAAVLVALIYIAAGLGQRLGSDQVEILHQFLERALSVEESGSGEGVRLDEPAIDGHVGDPL